MIFRKTFRSQINLKIQVKTTIYLVVILMLSMFEIFASAETMADKAQTALNDMKNLNDRDLLNADINWFKGGALQMGNTPKGTAAPFEWNNAAYKTETPWTAISPWFVLWPGTNHKAKNVRVKIYNIKLYILDKYTNKWIKLNTNFGNPTWARDYPFNFTSTSSDSSARTELDGRISYKLNDSFFVIHGGIPRIDLTKYVTNPLQIKAVYIAITTQLILNDASKDNDLASAELMLSAGADYYPNMDVKVANLNGNYVPMVGSSRYKLVTGNYPTVHYMVTVDPPGAPINTSEFTKAGGKVAMKADDFFVFPPPYLGDLTAPTAPTSLSKQSMTKSTTFATVKLVWSASSDNIGVVGYYIYRNGAKVGITKSLNFSDIILDTAKGIVYKYSVKSFDDAGNISASSNYLNITY